VSNLKASLLSSYAMFSKYDMSCAFANVSINLTVSYFLLWSNDYKRILVQYDVSENGKKTVLQSLNILNDGMYLVKDEGTLSPTMSLEETKARAAYASLKGFDKIYILTNGTNYKVLFANQTKIIIYEKVIASEFTSLR
jgi:hypothetical protein